jgi:LysR family glycine cleavage system transcriptional activator
MRPSLESLRTLAECVRVGSFAAAAETLFLTPAAISLRIRTLERDLGKILFVRSGPRVTPTNAAIALAARIDRAMDEIDAALGEFRGARPLIRVTAPPSFASRWLAPRVAQYQSDNPDVAIELDVSTDLRSRDTFDVAVRTGAGVWPGLRAQALFPVDLTPMLSPALAGDRRFARPSDLLKFALLPHPDWPQWFHEAGDVDEGQFRYAAIEYPSHELNAEAALAGEGVALLPRSLFQPLLARRKLVAPFDHVLAEADWHFALLHDRETRPEPATLVAWLQAQAQLDRGC